MKHLLSLIIAALIFNTLPAQISRDSIQSGFVLYEKRKSFENAMIEKTINKTFATDLTEDNEDKYEEACWSISQFMLRSPQIKAGFLKLFARYDSLQQSTKRSFLEAVYASYQDTFYIQINTLIAKEQMPKLFAMQAVYLSNATLRKTDKKALAQLLQLRFDNPDSILLLRTLKEYLLYNDQYAHQTIPSLKELFANQKNLHQKVIYSFQRWNRNYPGIAVIQNIDGSFAKDDKGTLITAQQLARAASNLPYFLTDGNTPQGIYSIQGVEVSHNNIIGPTPNIQLVLPFEADSVYWHTPYDSAQDVLYNYLSLLPASWRNYKPIQEAYTAGKIGRSEIISHGTTIDPDYYKGQPFYPLTPTMGCLCAKEIWNEFNGKLNYSDQYKLMQAFLATPGDKGYLIVINLNDDNKPVTREEIEKIIASQK